jgi:microcystin-dependent protein
MHHPLHAHYPPVPVGVILPYAGPCYGEDHQLNAQIGANLASAGWLVCAGQQLSRRAYSELFGVIGTAYGAPDGETFLLPDLRGQFLRGLDPSQTVDPGPREGGGVDKVGSTELDAFQGHEHTYQEPVVTSITGIQAGGALAASLVTLKPGETTDTDPLPPDDGTPRPNKETRPINIAINFIIRAANPPA